MELNGRSGRSRYSGAAAQADARVDLARLRRLLGAPGAEWLVRRVRRRMELGASLTGMVTLSEATEEQRAAVQRLLGRSPRPGRSLSVHLEAVEEVLRRSEISPEGLAAAVVALTGPVRVRSDAERAEAEAWEAAFAPLSTTCGRRPELQLWLARLRASGLVRRLAGGPEDAAPLLRGLAAVLAALPADGVALATFAARTCGDAHALDDGRPLATLALNAVRALTGMAAGSGAEWRREVWAAAGLLKDDLSTTALAIGLPGDAATATGRALAALRSAGQPAVLTLRQLVRDAPLPPPRGSVVRVCENPAVVSAAADRFGPDCPPLICTRGQPGAATMALLRLAAEGGADLRYHGDFDWGGIRIANALHRRVPWRPWRYTAADYRAAAHAGRGTPLTGSPVAAEWDPDLAAAVADAGIRIEEEQVVDDLLADLAGG